MGLPTNTDMRPNINLLLFDEDDWSSDFLGRFTVPHTHALPGAL